MKRIWHVYLSNGISLKFRSKETCEKFMDDHPDMNMSVSSHMFYAKDIDLMEFEDHTHAYEMILNSQKKGL